MTGVPPIQLKSTAHLFGDVQAGHLVIESGAVFVGAAKIGLPILETPARRLERIVGENLARMGLQVRGNLA
jgi:cytoskeletal protein CcmA (bactofilin family)